MTAVSSQAFANCLTGSISWLLLLYLRAQFALRTLPPRLTREVCTRTRCLCAHSLERVVACQGAGSIATGSCRVLHNFLFVMVV